METVISTSALNSYGSRVLTAGIDFEHYKRNPVLLWMHSRYRDTLPIGKMENLRLDGDKLIGTPVFDMQDEFAAQIAHKWETGVLNMVSAGLEVVETSTESSVLLPGQTRATIMKCKLIEVSIVDIGANDDAIKLYENGNPLQLSAGDPIACLPDIIQSTQKTNNMKQETLTLLGLAADASEQAVHDAVVNLKKAADEASTVRLSAISAAVDAAVNDRRITADKKEHFISLGKTAGLEALQATLQCMHSAEKPLDKIDTSKDGENVPQTFARLSDVPASERAALKANDPKQYAALYKAEYGVEINL